MARNELPDKLIMVSYLSQFFEYFRKESVKPTKGKVGLCPSFTASLLGRITECCAIISNAFGEDQACDSVLYMLFLAGIFSRAVPDITITQN